MSLISCKPHKTTWGSGKGMYQWNTILQISSFSVFRFFSNYFENGKGFLLKYESSNVSQWTFRVGTCGEKFSTPQGIFTSPSYPRDYPAKADCIYTISQPTGTIIQLNFLSMDIETHSTCKLDYLEIRDGSSNNSPPLSKLCGNEVPVFIHSSQNQLWMKWER